METTISPLDLLNIDDLLFIIEAMLKEYETPDCQFRKKVIILLRQVPELEEEIDMDTIIVALRQYVHRDQIVEFLRQYEKSTLVQRLLEDLFNAFRL